MRPLLFQLHLFDWILNRPSKSRTTRASRSSATVSDPALQEMWNRIQSEYFPDKPEIKNYTVYWSRRRQKRVLASCNIRRKIISVARELQDPLFHEWLNPLLYHEMCHAYLGEDVPKSRGKRLWHGAAFKTLEQRHPRIKDLEKWIREGGWLYAVRRDRGKRAR